MLLTGQARRWGGRRFLAGSGGWGSEARGTPFSLPGPRGIGGWCREGARAVAANCDQIAEENAAGEFGLVHDGADFWDEVCRDIAVAECKVDGPF